MKVTESVFGLACTLRCGRAQALAVGLLLALSGCAAAPGNAEQPSVAQAVFPAPPAQARYRYERSIYGSRDVSAQPGDEVLLKFLHKADRSPGAGLTRPHALAVDRGRVFVANLGESWISVFDLPGQHFYRVGDSGPGTLQEPLGLSADRSGQLYVADGYANSIRIYDLRGKYLRSIGGPSWFTRLIGVTAEPDGTRLYAIDAGESGGGPRVRVFNPRDGSHLFDFGAPGSGPGEFDTPSGVAIGKAGRLYVTDSGNFRVQIFDHQGRYLASFGSAGTHPGQFGRPEAISIDAAGEVYVVDVVLGNIQVFNPDGVMQYSLVGRDERHGPWDTLLPAGIAIDLDGSLYLLDRGYRKIDVYRPLG